MTELTKKLMLISDTAKLLDCDDTVIASFICQVDDKGIKNALYVTPEHIIGYMLPIYGNPALSRNRDSGGR